MVLDPTTPFSTVRDWVRTRCPLLIYRLVSGHDIQIKDVNGDETDGLDECSLVYLPCWILVINGIF